ncbi:MAG TPA: energy-coupling factor transporter transmembrane component T [Herpetosiphonaceae bacterium]
MSERSRPQELSFALDVKGSIARESRFHSLVWLLWLVAGVVAISTNPLLNLIIMAQAVLVATTCHTESPVGHAFGLFLRLGLLFVLTRTILSIIPVGGFAYGATPLITLPEFELPIWLGGLHLGGPSTLEMLIFGLVSGLRLWALILVFGAFNAVADHYGLLRRLPRMLFHAGLITTIALTFVPQVISHLQTIRDAQRVRGHRFRTWRDGLPLIVPLLSGGLERSIQLAEAMDSRGYGHTTSQQRSTLLAQGVIIVGLTILALGLYFGLTGSWQGWLAAGAGGVLAIEMLRRMAGSSRRTRYLRDRWRRRDTLVAATCLLLITGMTALRLADRGGLLYTTLPRVTLPPFEPLVGVLLLLLSTPALIDLLNVEEPDERQHRVQHSHLAD